MSCDVSTCLVFSCVASSIAVKVVSISFLYGITDCWYRIYAFANHMQHGLFYDSIAMLSHALKHLFVAVMH